MGTRHHDSFSLPHPYRREPYPRMSRGFSPPESYPIINVSYLADRYGYSDYMLRGERPIFHPYFEAEGIPFRREMPVPYHEKYPYTNGVNGPIKYRKNGSRKEDSQSFRRKSYYDLWNMKSSNGVHLNDDNFMKTEKDPVIVEGNLENPDHIDSKSSVVKYCLDRHTQHTIHGLQNDFRLTKRYKSFVMYELPQIPDFRPTPAITSNKFHDRFKCLFKELLDANDLNVNSNSDPENPEENKEKEDEGRKEPKMRNNCSD